MDVFHKEHFMPKIVSLEEVEARRWVAKYKGNYGTYTIRLTVADYRETYKRRSAMMRIFAEKFGKL